MQQKTMLQMANSIDIDEDAIFLIVIQNFLC